MVININDGWVELIATGLLGYLGLKFAEFTSAVKTITRNLHADKRRGR